MYLIMNNIELKANIVCYVANIPLDKELSDDDLEVAEKWGLVDTYTKTTDVENGWELIQFVISSKDYPNKFYTFYVYHDEYIGWSLDGMESIDSDQIIILTEATQVLKPYYIPIIDAEEPFIFSPHP